MIAASIILYNPDIKRLKENISSIESQVNTIIFVDNGSNNIAQIKQCLSTNAKYYLITNSQNMGIAAALNQALYYAYSNKFEWVLTLDQDSISPPDLVLKLSAHIDIPRVGIIAPNFQDRNAARPVEAMHGWRFIERCITSASLTNTSIWKEINGFNEELFIDYVDYEYCSRLIKSGFAIIQDNDITLLHEIGKSKRLYFGKHSFTLWEHSAMRDYYLVRNGLYYCATHPTVWEIRQEKKNIILRCFMIIIFEKKKFTKLCALLKGWRDSFSFIRHGKKEIHNEQQKIYQAFFNADKNNAKH